MVKAIGCLFLLLQFTFPDVYAQEGYTITGRIDESQNGRFIHLYGIDYSDLNPKIVDSFKIENGRFKFVGKINTPGLLASLYIKDSRAFFTQFFIENKNIGITATLRDSTHPGGKIVATNNPITEQYNAWQKELAPFSSYYQLSYVIDSLEKAKAPDSAIAVVKAKKSALGRQMLDTKIKFIKEHPDYYISLLWLRVDLFHSLQSNPQVLENLFIELTPELRLLPEGKALQKAIAVVNAIQPGHIAPDFVMQNINGKSIKLSDYRGKYVLLDFWASWCGPCIEKLPELKKAYADYRTKGIEFISISLDDNRKKWLDAVNKYQIKWPNISELKGWEGQSAQEYNIKYIPKTILIGKKGEIIAVDPDLPRQLQSLFNDVSFNEEK